MKLKRFYPRPSSTKNPISVPAVYWAVRRMIILPRACPWSVAGKVGHFPRPKKILWTIACYRSRRLGECLQRAIPPKEKKTRIIHQITHKYFCVALDDDLCLLVALTLHYVNVRQRVLSFRSWSVSYLLERRLSVCLSILLPICISVHLLFCLSIQICVSIVLPIFISVNLSAYLHLYICSIDPFFPETFVVRKHMTVPYCCKVYLLS